jgi:hypothetical protein
MRKTDMTCSETAQRTIVALPGVEELAEREQLPEVGTVDVRHLREVEHDVRGPLGPLLEEGGKAGELLGEGGLVGQLANGDVVGPVRGHEKPPSGGQP